MEESVSVREQAAQLLVFVPSALLHDCCTKLSAYALGKLVSESFFLTPCRSPQNHKMATEVSSFYLEHSLFY